ncbi:MAG: hypothetical protein KTR31_30345 [Myxococcales bacterium]|nr:hypothetical protein [Myxococcales bacterium]
MELPIRDQLEIFWSESVLYVGVYVVYAAVVAAVAWGLEFWSQRSDVGALTLGMSNATLCGLAIASSTVGLFVVSWRAASLGGETWAFFVVSILTILISYMARRLLLGAMGVQLPWPDVLCSGAAVAYALPFVAFFAYVAALGAADWSK